MGEKERYGTLLKDDNGQVLPMATGFSAAYEFLLTDTWTNVSVPPGAVAVSIMSMSDNILIGHLPDPDNAFRLPWMAPFRVEVGQMTEIWLQSPGADAPVYILWHLLGSPIT